MPFKNINTNHDLSADISPTAVTCSGVDCGSDATTLRCPTCSKMGKASYFCSHDCFKSSWEKHKATHRRANYLLHIHLCPNEIVDPPITRTISCPAIATFETLHNAIQVAFGWATTHSYDFVVKDPEYVALDLMTHIKRRSIQDSARNRGLPVPPLGPREFLLRIVEPEVPGRGAIDLIRESDRMHPHTAERPSTEIKLFSLFDSPQFGDKKVVYNYDFGPRWEHYISVIGRPEATDHFACTDGEGHPCAEDVGMYQGWQRLKAAYRAADPTAEQRMSMDWFEGKSYPSASNGDSAGLKGSKVRSWPKTKVNTKLADLRV